jgi:PAS domain S-box-containing protein
MTRPGDEPSYRAHVEQAPIGIFEVNQRGEYVDVNESGCEMVGYSQAELLELSVADLVPDTDDPGNIPSFAEVRETGHMRTEGQIRHKDGHMIDVLLEAVDIGGGQFVAYVQDIAAQKEYETELERTRNELRQIIDLIPDPLYAKNRDDVVLLSNEANAELHGLTPDEIEGERERELIRDVGNIENYDKYRQRELEVMETDEPVVFEEELEGPDGTTHVFKITRIPFGVAGSDDDAVLGYARDITELKESEQELEQQRDNLEILNEVLRHDVRNDLQLVTSYADLLAEECDDDEMTDQVATIRESADHAVELTETAREIADVMLSATVRDQQVNLRTVLEKEMTEIQSSHPDAAVTYGTTVPSVSIDANEMLASVFRNLLKNAIQHSHKQLTEVTVSATEQNGTVQVRIADNGPGVADAQKDAIFGKGEHGLESAGTGMGLYLVDTLVTSYGGAVWVEDNDPEGAIFVVELPTAR